VERIVGIGDGAKRDDPTNIGKFGIGFKAVFSYTNTPEIHSGEFHFRIHDLVVPDETGVDKCHMGARETRFIFPFDRPKKLPAQASEEIERGLRALGDNTLLFLSHNNQLRDALAQLVTESLEDVRDRGLLTVASLEVLPIDDDNLPEFYEPIREKIIEAFRSRNLVPTRSGEHRKGASA